MRTELPKFPSDDPMQDDLRGSTLDAALQDIDARLKKIEYVLGLLTVNNATRAVLWNGPVNGSGLNHLAQGALNAANNYMVGADPGLGGGTRMTSGGAGISATGGCTSTNAIGMFGQGRRR